MSRPSRQALSWGCLGIAVLVLWGLYLWWGRPFLTAVHDVEDPPSLGGAAVAATAACLARAIMKWRSAAEDTSATEPKPPTASGPTSPSAPTNPTDGR